MSNGNPFFTVNKEKMVTESGLLVPDRYALINDETKGLLGISAGDYEVIHNLKVADLFDRALVNYGREKVIDHMDALTRKWKRRIVFNGDEVTFDIDGRGDKVNMMLEIFNGYDVRSGFGYEILAFRSVCENGLVMGRKTFFRESYYHFVDNPRKLLLSFEMKFDAFKENMDQWTEWTRTPFNENDFKVFVESRDYLTEKVREEVTSAFCRVLNKFNDTKTKWGAFNVITYLATHETKARQGSNLFSNRYNLYDRLATDFYIA